MCNQKKYQLISGIFNVGEARSIILSFYNHKIQYHSQQLLRALECNDGNVGSIQQKLQDLNQTSLSIIQFLEKTNDPDNLVEVTGFIEVNLDPLHSN